MKQKKVFDEINDKLCTVYPQIDKKLQDIEENEIGKNTDKDSKDLVKLKDLKADLIGQERKLKDLVQTGEKLASNLIDMNMKKKADEVRKTINDLKNKHSYIEDDISGKEELLDSAVSQQQNVMNRLESLQDWLRETENTLNERRPISLDKDRLAQQLKEQRLINAEIDSNKALLDRLSKEAMDVTGSDDGEATVFDLSERQVSKHILLISDFLFFRFFLKCVLLFQKSIVAFLTQKCRLLITCLSIIQLYQSQGIDIYDTMRTKHVLVNLLKTCFKLKKQYE